ncbi:MAG: ParA family protein [Pseudomonadales bacterium]
MPVITFASSKGGVGKSTTALALATQLALKTKVTVIDVDPNKPLMKWQKRGGQCSGLTIVANHDELDLMNQIDAAAKQTPFVIVDLEGSANIATAYAIACSSLVIIPCQPSVLDSDEASKACKLVENENRNREEGKKIPYVVCLTKVSPAILTRTQKHLEASLAESNIALLQTRMVERDAYKGMFSFAQTLEQMNSKDVPGVNKAILNSRQFTKEVVELLKAFSKSVATERS